MLYLTGKQKTFPSSSISNKKNLNIYPHAFFKKARGYYECLWVEFNQTGYMTSPHGKGVQEQYNLSLWCPSVFSHTVF